MFMATILQSILLAIAALLAVGAASAAEMTLFEDADFQGRSMTLRGPLDNFDRSGMNDKVSSIIVRSGSWILCTDAFYAGRCNTFGPGRYRQLDRGLADAISSARPADYAPPRPPPPPPSGGVASIQLFEQRNFGGRSITLTSNVSNFDPLGYNDRADAAVVRGGVWRLCSDAYMRGQCRDFGPGRYNNLGSLGGQVSSAAIVQR
jgi:hypothetical protein